MVLATDLWSHVLAEGVDQGPGTRERCRFGCACHLLGLKGVKYGYIYPQLLLVKIDTIIKMCL